MGEVISLWVIGLAQVGVEHILSAGCLPPAEGSTVTNTELISFTSPGFSTFSVQRPCDQRPCELASTCGKPKLRAELSPSLARARYFPGATHSRRGGPCSPSREFGLALHQIQRAIEAHVSLKQTLYSWNQIATSSRGKVAEAAASIGEMVLQGRSNETCRPSEADFYAES